MELNVRNRGASSFTFGQRRLHRDRGHPSRNFQGGCFLDEIFPGPCWEVNAFFSLCPYSMSLFTSFLACTSLCTFLNCKTNNRSGGRHTWTYIPTPTHLLCNFWQDSLLLAKLVSNFVVWMLTLG